MWMCYSYLDKYNTCPKQYWYDKVEEQKPPTPESKHNAIVGSVTQRVLEDYYNEELYEKVASEDMDNHLKRLSHEHFTDYIENNHIDWNDVTCRFDDKYEPLSEIQEILPKAIDRIQKEDLHGASSKSEIKIAVPFREEHMLFGYLDFIIRTGDDEVILLDGKSSRHREEYVDPDQLYFYTYLFLKKYEYFPDRVGFFYFRYADQGEEAFDWIDVTKEDLLKIEKKSEETIKGILKEDFEADPDPKYCKWCPWESVCEERLEQKKKNKRKRRYQRGESLDDGEDEDVEAIVTFDDM